MITVYLAVCAEPEACGFWVSAVTKATMAEHYREHVESVHQHPMVKHQIVAIEKTLYRKGEQVPT